LHVTLQRHGPISQVTSARHTFFAYYPSKDPASSLFSLIPLRSPSRPAFSSATPGPYPIPSRPTPPLLYVSLPGAESQCFCCRRILLASFRGSPFFHVMHEKRAPFHRLLQRYPGPAPPPPPAVAILYFYVTGAVLRPLFPLSSRTFSSSLEALPRLIRPPLYLLSGPHDGHVYLYTGFSSIYLTFTHPRILTRPHICYADFLTRSFDIFTPQPPPRFLTSLENCDVPPVGHPPTTCKQCRLLWSHDLPSSRLNFFFLSLPLFRVHPDGPLRTPLLATSPPPLPYFSMRSPYPFTTSLQSCAGFSG